MISNATTRYWLPLALLATVCSGLWVSPTLAGQDQNASSPDDASQPSQVDDAAAEIQTFFEELQSAQIEEGLLLNIDRFLDIDAIVLQLLTSLEMESKVGPRLALNLAFRQAFYKQFSGSENQWHRFEITAVETNDASTEADVMVRIWRLDGITARTRYWMLKGDKGWRIYDVEDVGLNLRVSTLTTMMARELYTDGDLPATANAMEVLGNVTNLIAEGDFYSADLLLQTIENDELPETLESLRWMLAGSVALALYEPHRALECYDRAKVYQEDIPILPYNRAVALNQLGRSEEALESALRFVDRYGSDADAQLEIGIALESLDRVDEAIEAYRAGLEDTPNSIDNLIMLAGILPEDELDEIEVHYENLSFPERDFEWIAGDLYQYGNLAALRKLLSLFREDFPQDIYGLYYDAALLYEDEEFEEAAELMIEAMEQADDDTRYFYTEFFYDCCLEARRPIYAYDLSRDKREGFDFLMYRLVSGEEWAMAELLLERHLEADGDDPNYHFHLGEFYFYQERYQEADDAYADGDRIGDIWLQDQIRSSRIRCWYHLGKARKALTEFGPKSETFDTIAEMYFLDERMDDLAEWVDAYDDKSHVGLIFRGYWEVALAWVNEDYERAAIDGMRVLERFENTSEYEERLDPFYWRLENLDAIVVRSLLRLGHRAKALKVARQSTDRLGDLTLEVIALAAAGDVEKFQSRTAELLEWMYAPESLLEDEDFSTALRDVEAMQGMREWFQQQILDFTID